MVAGWSVFGLTGTPAGETRGGGFAPAIAAPAPSAAIAEQVRAATPGPSREIRLAQSPTAANDAGPAPAAGRRQSRIVAATAHSAGAPAPGSAPLSRARGIGSRFRPAPARSMEKLR
jgi:type IV secretion system protein VirB6